MCVVVCSKNHLVILCCHLFIKYVKHWLFSFIFPSLIKLIYLLFCDFCLQEDITDLVKYFMCSMCFIMFTSAVVYILYI